ncbi:hypothetical protein [Bradyrhizobium cenepequi]|nr:hypothetical protein [Bradyrhizobium cenepequi]MCA6106153.1 hypothetical protein [Bradyrhizobium cenepequi]
MRRIMQRWITSAVPSVGIVTAVVGASYRQRLGMAAAANHEHFPRSGS